MKTINLFKICSTFLHFVFYQKCMYIALTELINYNSIQVEDVLIVKFNNAIIFSSICLQNKVKCINKSDILEVKWLLTALNRLKNNKNHYELMIHNTWNKPLYSTIIHLEWLMWVCLKVKHSTTLLGVIIIAMRKWDSQGWRVSKENNCKVREWKNGRHIEGIENG